MQYIYLGTKVDKFAWKKALNSFIYQGEFSSAIRFDEATISRHLATFGKNGRNRIDTRS